MDLDELGGKGQLLSSLAEYHGEKPDVSQGQIVANEGDQEMGKRLVVEYGYYYPLQRRSRS